MTLQKFQKKKKGFAVIECSFELNNKPMSALVYGTWSIPAFSGLGRYVNSRAAICVADQGPIPVSTYYIVDRESGGLLGALRDALSRKGDWFALYADDGSINDETFCDGVKRGNFRLHPKGTLGISKGCITINDISDFQRLHAILKKTTMQSIPGSKLKAYGKVVVK